MRRWKAKRAILLFRKFVLLCFCAGLIHMVSKSWFSQLTTYRGRFGHHLVNVAVVIPLTRSQAFDRLPRTLQKWKSRKPCLSTGPPASKLSLVFNFDGDLSQFEDVEAQILRLWDDIHADIRTCFHAIHMISSNLSSTETKYPLGPCLQFKRTFPALEKLGFDHWMQFEPDVEPIRSGWGDRIIDLAEQNFACRKWWQLGSFPMYESMANNAYADSNGNDLHLNGNSLYCLNSQGFSDYRTHVSRSYPEEGCIVSTLDDSLAGFDHALYHFRMNRENHGYMKGKFSYFKDDPFILNFGPANFSEHTIWKMSPSTMLVHSGYKYADPQRQAILDQKYLTHDLTHVLQSLYAELLHRTASPSEMDFFCRVFQPIHGEPSIMKCLLSNIFSLRARNAHSTGQCDGSDLSRIFSSEFEALLTSQYIMQLHQIPGPEAFTFHRDKCLQQPSLAPLNNKHTNCGVKTVNRTSSELANSNNHVMMGSYQHVCSHSKYDPKKDVLMCEMNKTLRTLRHPFRCAEDISINSAIQLVC